MVYYGSLAVPIVAETGSLLKALSKRPAKEEFKPRFYGHCSVRRGSLALFCPRGKPVFNRLL